MTKEKIVAKASKSMVVVTDSTKYVKTLRIISLTNRSSFRGSLVR